MIFELIARISFFSRRAAARHSISPSCLPDKSFYSLCRRESTSYYLHPRVAPVSMAPLNPCNRREFVRNSRVVAAESRECEIIKWNSSNSRIIRYVESFDCINLVKVHVIISSCISRKYTISACIFPCFAIDFLNFLNC